MNSSRALAGAGVLLALATTCGAFGAHALRAQLAPERLQLWDTAVRYQFLHALGLMGVGLTLRTSDVGALRLAALLLIAAGGVVLGQPVRPRPRRAARARRADTPGRTGVDRRLAAVCMGGLAGRLSAGDAGEREMHVRRTA